MLESQFQQTIQLFIQMFLLCSLRMPFVFQVQAERMQALQVLSLTLLSVLAVSAQSIGSGKCPEPPVQQNFDPTRVNFFLYTVKKKNSTYLKPSHSPSVV